MAEHAGSSYSKVEEVTRLKRTNRTKAAGRDVVDLEIEKKKGGKGEGKGGKRAYKRLLFSSLHSSFLTGIWSRNRHLNVLTSLLSTIFMKPTCKVPDT